MRNLEDGCKTVSLPIKPVAIRAATGDNDNTDYAKMLQSVKNIEIDGMIWGASKIVPIGYGIKKMQIMCTVEDKNVSEDKLAEEIQELEEGNQEFEHRNNKPSPIRLRKPFNSKDMTTLSLSN